MITFITLTLLATTLLGFLRVLVFVLRTVLPQSGSASRTRSPAAAGFGRSVDAPIPTAPPDPFSGQWRALDDIQLKRLLQDRKDLL